MLGQKGRAYSRSTNDQVLWRAWTYAIQRVSHATKSDFVSAAASAVRVAFTARLYPSNDPSYTALAIEHDQTLHPGSDHLIQVDNTCEVARTLTFFAIGSQSIAKRHARHCFPPARRTHLMCADNAGHWGQIIVTESAGNLQTNSG